MGRYHVDRGLPLPASDDVWLDDAARLAGTLRRHGEAGLEEAEGVEPAVMGAYRLHAGPPLRRWLLEAWVLTGSPPDSVAVRAGTSAAVVEAYEHVWFDVRGLLGTKAYIAAYAIPPCSDLAGVLKAFAYALGPHALQELLAVLVRPGEEGAVAAAGRADPLIVELAVSSYLLPVRIATAPAILKLHGELQELLPPGGGYQGSPARRRQRLRAALGRCKAILKGWGSLDDLLWTALFGQKRGGRRGRP